MREPRSTAPQQRAEPVRYPFADARRMHELAMTTPPLGRA
eukprot:CAMPEP_0181199838 /NCGR_PEP_ID=MMETSP1096-20121128/17405_1 /TAXON_ID=156174 ORGANISM="Chrysochromulina ericina, Strain CCMP281" /NCGR_SAMPLE_ID=MMETSP1096 /ASSEMBLY_ACC=CAM_ASM_000453 /LENGTH=39 /DNA_ID= /DNA_START= /DNA_END= /DNA_ORIENTATION=